MNQDKTENYNFCDDIFTITSNTEKIRKFRYGNPVSAKRLEVVSGKETQFEVSYRLEKGEIDIDKSFPLTELYGIKGIRNASEVFQQRAFPFGGNALLVLRNLYSNRPEVIVNTKYETWSSLRVTQVEPAGRLLTHIVTLKLLQEGFLPIHSAAVKIHGKTILIVAPPNTGKTYTAMKLVDLGGKFISEDLGIVAGSDFYGLPYTETVEKRNPDNPLFFKLKQKIHGVFFKTNFRKGDVFSTNTIKLNEALSKGKIDTIFILRKGKKTLESLSENRTVKLLESINSIEFGYSSDKMIRFYLFLNGPRHIRDCMNIEKELIRNLASRHPAYLVSGEKVEDYNNLILKKLGS